MGNPSCALVEAQNGREISYAGLDAEAEGLARGLRGGNKALIFCFLANDIPSVIRYLAARRSGHAVALLDPSLPAELVAPLVELYDPEWILGRLWPGARQQAALVAYRPGARPPVPDDLALLLSTSGTTGSAKWVRHSARAVDHNAAAIAQALRLTPGCRPLLSLPIHLAFGHSVLTSHFAVGATVVLCDQGPLSAQFWRALTGQACNALYGVPWSLEVVERAGLAQAPSVGRLLVAGGKLPESRAARLGALMEARKGELVIMYGQSEAVARMAILPGGWLAAKPGGAGVAVAGGRFQVVDRELVYRGPNVMLGYARSRADFGLGDVMGGTLPTGDLGRIDEDGVVFISGRSGRIAKVAGLRVNLDEVEAMVPQDVAAAATADGVGVRVYLEGGEAAAMPLLRAALASRLRLSPALIAVQRVAALPRSVAGKVDYQRLGTPP